MPYKSEAQRRYFYHALAEGKISQAVIDEYDKASDGMKLPERLHPKKKKSILNTLQKAAATLLKSNPARPTKDLITPEITSGNKKLREGIKVNKDTTDQVKFTKKIRNIPMGVEKLGQKLKRLLSPKDYQQLLSEKKKLDDKRKASLADSAGMDKEDLESIGKEKLATAGNTRFEEIESLRRKARVRKEFLKGKDPEVVERFKARAKAKTMSKLKSRHARIRLENLSRKAEIDKTKENKERKLKNVAKVRELKREKAQLAKSRITESPYTTAAKKTLSDLTTASKRIAQKAYGKGKEIYRAYVQGGAKLAPQKKAPAKVIKKKQSPISKVQKAKIVSKLKSIKPKASTPSMVPKRKAAISPQKSKVQIKSKPISYKGPGDTYYKGKMDMSIAPLKGSRGVGTYKAKPASTKSSASYSKTKLAAMFDLGFLSEMNKLAAKVKAMKKVVTTLTRGVNPLKGAKGTVPRVPSGELVEGARRVAPNAPRGGLLKRVKDKKEELKRKFTGPRTQELTSRLSREKATTSTMAPTKKRETIKRFIRHRGRTGTDITKRRADIKATPGPDLSPPKMPVIKPTLNRPVGPPKMPVIKPTLNRPVGPPRKPSMYYPLKALRT